MRNALCDSGHTTQNPPLYKSENTPDTPAHNKKEASMADDPDQDKVEKFEVSDGKTPGTYELYIKTKSEEFDFIIDGENLQKLGDQIYEAIDKNEGKQ
jgi:hypothetical protein